MCEEEVKEIVNIMEDEEPEDLEMENGKVLRMELKYFCPECGLPLEESHHPSLGNAIDINRFLFCKHCGVKYLLKVIIVKAKENPHG